MLMKYIIIVLHMNDTCSQNPADRHCSQSLDDMVLGGHILPSWNVPRKTAGAPSTTRRREGWGFRRDGE